MVWLIIMIIIIALDRVSKMTVLSSLVNHPITVIDKFFYLSYLENRGAAWGIFQNGRFFLIALTVIVAIVIGYFLYKSDQRILNLSLSFILGGAIGNLIDRVLRGSVVDFLEFHFGAYVFPTFNVADSFVVVGTIILAYYMLFVYKEKKD